MGEMNMRNRNKMLQRAVLAAGILGVGLIPKASVLAAPELPKGTITAVNVKESGEIGRAHV